MNFASVNQLFFKSTSRKDDLISACYLLFFLFNSNQIPFIDRDEDSNGDSTDDVRNKYKGILKIKNDNSLSKMAKSLDNLLITSKYS